MREITQEEIEKEVKRVGFDLLNYRDINHYPDNWYLKVVLAARPNRTEYVTWIYNAELGGLYNGHYTEKAETAKSEYNIRA